MAKTATSLRLDDQQIEQLDKLVNYYKELQEREPMNNKFNVRVSKASVVEMLIKKEFIEIFMKMK